MKRNIILTCVVFSVTFVPGLHAADAIQLGPRPYYLIDRMTNSELKKKLMACSEGPFRRTLFSIGHRGAPMQYPEHTVESNVAAGRISGWL